MSREQQRARAAPEAGSGGQPGQRNRGRTAGLLLALAAAGPVHPQSPPPGDGAIGPTSTAATTIRLVIPERIRVSGVRDILLGPYAGAALSGSSPACISRNGPGSYSVTLTSANGAFELRAPGVAIPYTVAWAASALPYGRASGSLPADQASLAPCTPVADRLTVTVQAEAMEDAPPGTYGDTLQVLVTPL